MKSTVNVAGCLTMMCCLALASTGCASKGRPEESARLNMTQARSYLDRGLSDSALASFGLALEDNPLIADAALGMGHIYRQWNQFPLAEKSYERAVRIDPANFDAQYCLGLTRQYLGKLTEAVKCYLRALTLKPDSFDANAHLASAYLELGKPGDALPYAKKSVELRPDDGSAQANLGAAAMMLGQYDQAVGAFHYAIEQGDTRPQIALGLGDALLHLNRTEAALQVLLPLLENKPTATMYERVAFARFRLGQLDKAAEHYRHALELSPDDIASLNGMGACDMARYVKSDRSDTTIRENALDYWRRSLRIKPDQPKIIDLMNRYRNL